MPIHRAAAWRLPQLDLADRKSARGGHVEDQLGDVLRSRTFVHQIQRLSQLLKHGHGGVRALENHAVVEVLVDPTVHDAFDLREIQHHAAIVQPRSLEGDDYPAVVSVQVAALARVVQQTVSVAEVDFT